MEQILEIMEKDARITPEEIAKITGLKVEKVRKAIKNYEKNGTIIKYKTIINKDMVGNKSRTVNALIEVKVSPQKNVGFDRVAERIYRFPEVKSCYLLSGGYDLLILVSGKDIHSVASFVSEKLAPMENIGGTVTHFLLKRYKVDGDILKSGEKDKRIAISF